MNKLEKHIKHKLQEREIEPSKTAWQKIESSLEAEPVQKQNKIYWYTIAAVLAGIILVSAIFFSEEDPVPVNTKIVDAEPKTNQPIVTNELDPAKSTVASELSEKGTQILNSIDSPLASQSTDFAQVDEPLIVDKDLIEVASQMESSEPQELLINQKVDEVMAQVLQLESQNRQVTDAEVDSLLRAAQREVLADKIVADGGSVNAMALLDEVEEELDQSFRDQIFEALKDGYTKLRTAVATRNN